MLLRNKRTGFVYAYTKALATDSEYEIWTEEEAKEEPVESPPKKRVVRKKRATKNGNTVQQGDK
jgi:hypothetical protein